jgi:hypothetical protein
MRNILVNDYDGVNIGIVTDERKEIAAPFEQRQHQFRGSNATNAQRCKRIFLVADCVISKRLTPR